MTGIKTWQERCEDAQESTYIAITASFITKAMLREIVELRAALFLRRRRVDTDASTFNALNLDDRAAYGPVLRIAPEGFKLVTDAEFAALTLRAALYASLGGVPVDKPLPTARLVD